MKILEKENKIRQYFDFYQNEVLPKVEKLATQTKEGYHGLYTHTKSVVFRAIDYALELGKNPLPVIFAAACHDMARVNDFYDEEHGKNAVPFAQQVMDQFPNKLTKEEQASVLYAIENHTTGTLANNYISACLWDADRTRLSWERGYSEKFFNTEYAKKVAAGSCKNYIDWQNMILDSEKQTSPQNPLLKALQSGKKDEQTL